MHQWDVMNLILELSVQGMLQGGIGTSILQAEMLWGIDLYGCLSQFVYV